MNKLHGASTIATTLVVAVALWLFYKHITRRGLNGQTHASQVLVDEKATTAKLLQAAGARVYGSRNCGYTTRQMEKFGRHAGMIDYVECSQGNPMCRSITGFPTWKIGGFTLMGDQPIGKLHDYAERVLRGEGPAESNKHVHPRI